MKRALALILSLVMCVGLFTACGEQKNPGGNDDESKDTPLVVGYSAFNQKFSPFFSETEYDQDVWLMTSLSMLNSDRQGQIIMKGIEGETHNYNGTDYTYYGPADCEIVQKDDGTVDYNFKMREDLVFSDGEKVTIDDVIFSMYVLCDPTYDGNSTLYAAPIQGMAAYRAGMTTLAKALAAAGRDNADFTYWTEEQQTKFWDNFDKGLVPFAEGIVAACVEGGMNTEGDIAGAAANWGFDGLAADATIQDFAMAIGNQYGWVFSAMEKEVGNTDALSTMMDADVYNDYPTTGVKTGESADSITGIKKTGDYSMTVTLDKVDATAIYQLGVTIAPLHYYGDPAQFDAENNKFGFPKGDLSSVRAKTTEPMGAGPYKFLKYEDGVVYFEANENYFLGAPKTKYLNFQQCMSDDDKLNGVITGTIDITDPTFSNDTVDAITKANNGSGVDGDKVTTDTVDNLGYGYLGMSAACVNVGGEPGSDASKNLRKAFATVFSVYRDVAIESYYGERASVINYPISNTSWAAPQPTDDGYKVAFSVDVNGNDIYTSGMSADERYAAALQAALGYFEAAGYTVTDGKLTAAPAGAELEYELQIPADGSGDHPSFMMVSEAKKALETIGMNLIITDLSDSSGLWTGIDAHQVDMWCAAWGATVDPDMYQIYYSDVANCKGDLGTGKNPFGGAAQGGSNKMYCIADPELDNLIMTARESLDQSYRKTMYKACLDIVVDWAVEVPVYQRQNAIIFSTERVNMSTVTPDITTFYKWYSEIQNIELN
ncbi:MAG: ABC transporter substrate-binding protein [Oscillospiraceae bacterium]